MARGLFGPPYLCAKPWHRDCFVQCGDNGVVFTAGTIDKLAENPMSVLEDGAAIESGDTALGYVTAFFEAFNADQNAGGFIRGEGATVFAAEGKAWDQQQRFSACEHTDGFERRGYKNGAGFCVSCGMFKSHVFKVGPFVSGRFRSVGMAGPVASGIPRLEIDWVDLRDRL